MTEQTNKARAVHRPQSPDEQTRVFIVEDHPLMRRGLSQVIEDESDLTVCGAAGTVEEAIRGIHKYEPDVTLLDLSLGHESGMDLIKQLAAQHDQSRMLVVSRYDENLYAERCLQAGALGYISKEAPSDDLVAALRQVARGRVHLSPDLASRLLGRFTTSHRGTDCEEAASPRFSDRELQVIELLGQGLTTRQVAEALSLSIKTVESYQASLKQKLQLENNNQLIRWAVQWSAE